MEDNNIIISDENLIKFFTKENLEDMANLFSNGNFQELLYKHFYTNNSCKVNEVEQETKYSNDDDNNINEINQLSSVMLSNSNENNNNNLNTNINNNDKEVIPEKNNIPKKLPEFNFQLIERLLDDELSQQIILTLVLFCFLKKKELPKEAKLILDNYNYPIEAMIFPLNFLKIKYYIKSDNISLAIDLLNKLIIVYEKYKLNIEEKKKDLRNICTIETFHQKFIYFNNLFNYLFCMNDIDTKIKKLYFELKLCFYHMKHISQAYKTILTLYQKYPEDILIQFELAKDSIINSKPDIYQNILEIMKKNKNEENNEKNKKIYDNFIIYLEALCNLACNQYSEAKNKFEEIAEKRKEENNDILNNNIAVMNLYKNNLKESYDKLFNIYQENKNEYIKDTINIIQDKFNIK